MIQGQTKLGLFSLCLSSAMEIQLYFTELIFVRLPRITSARPFRKTSRKIVITRRLRLFLASRRVSMQIQLSPDIDEINGKHK